MVKRILFAAAALALAIAAQSCVPTATKEHRAKDSPSDDAGYATAAPAYEGYSASGGQTFLDTLNRGKEIALAVDDLPRLEDAQEGAAPMPAQGGAGAAGAVGETRFRIQILAASEADMVRREKLKAEAALGRPVFMVSEQSLYKLHVGDFKTKAEADAALPEVKKGGYGDAWVVSAKAAAPD